MERITRPKWGTTLALLLILICGFVRPASASIVYVNKAAPGAVHDGTSWATAFTSIQPAIDAAKTGDEVWVTAGTYVENITLVSGVSLYGGFVGTEIDRTQRKWKRSATIIENSRGKPDAVVYSPTQGAILDGFTLTLGGTGVYVDGAATISNCALLGNSTGACLLNGSLAISDCDISGCTVRGVEVLHGTIDLTDCTVNQNDSDGVGVFRGTATVTNCTISGNSLVGVHVVSGTALVVNCIVALNGTGLYRLADSAQITVSHTDICGNASKNFDNLADQTGTNGNISVDPLFVNGPNGDYHLLVASPCRDAGDDSSTTSSETDGDGMPRIHGSHVDMGAYEIQRGIDPWSSSLGTTVTGGVTVTEGAAYVSGNDGKLYARNTADGTLVPGFPVDMTAAVGAPVKLPSRPAVYYGKTGKAIYLTTDRGDVVRVLPNGTVAWHVRPFPGQTVSTPAVTPDGYVYVNLSTGSGPFNNYVFKLDEATGTPLTLSPFLGYTNATDMGDFSPAANSRYLYVNSGWGSGSGLTLLNQDNLTVRSSFAGGQQCLSPLLLGSDLLLATRAGKAYKVNAVTMNPDLGFGHFGVADVGSQITAAPFADAAGNVYLGTADGRILKWTPGSGWFQPVYTTTGRIAGLTIDRSAGVLGFGTSNGAFTQVPLNNPAAATTVTPGGPISNGTVYESLTDRFIVVTDNGVLSGYPAIR